ncbi:MAG: diacylglycerol kinase family lipid kinase [Deltaproteobacteria bacterium]|nr:diacylglycerol kinase family lipid kinase [Deltaproteobacteria bacterium]
MKIRFIVNPNAGAGDRAGEITQAVRETFGDSEGLFEVKSTLKKGDAKRLAREAVEGGYKVVFACGGDGTINEVASQLVSTETVLGIIPGGSGNGLSRALKIPFNAKEAVGLAKKGRVRAIDAGIMDGRYFFSTAGLGFDAHLSMKYDKRSSGRRGILPYVPLAVLEFFRFKPEPLTLALGENKFSRITPFMLTVANTEEFGGSAIIAPGAVPDDGLLDLCVIKDIGFGSAIMTARKILNGSIETSKHYQRILTPSAKVRRSKPGAAHVDGEPFMAGETIEFGLLPKSLNVLIKQ